MTAGSYCYIGPQGIVHGTTVSMYTLQSFWIVVPASSQPDHYFYYTNMLYRKKVKKKEIETLQNYAKFFVNSRCKYSTLSLSHNLVQLTVMNAGRKYLNLGDLSGRVFLTSGLGGMSGAQAKASVVAGCIGVIAEVTVPYGREECTCDLTFVLCIMCVLYMYIQCYVGQSECTYEEI